MSNAVALKDEKIKKRGLSSSTQCYLLIGLQIIGFFVFTIYPILWAAAKSWYYYDMIDANTAFTGWTNFKQVFADAAYWRSWVITFKFALIKLSIEIPIALVLATLLSKGLKGSNFFRTMYYLPSIVSVAIVGVMISNMFDYFGIFNNLLMSAGIIKAPIDWFADANAALMMLVIGSCWTGFGANVLYFCAAINNVPKDMYEAAEIDGASQAVQFFKITLPMIAPVATTVLLLALNSTLHVGEYILVTTNGSPAGSTYTVGAYLVDKFVPGFADSRVNIGYGCSLALVTSAIYSCIAFLYIKGTNKLNNIY